MIAYLVEQRRREMATRLALGAQSRQLVGLVVGGALRLGALGCALGRLLFLGAWRALAALVFRTGPSDLLVVPPLVLGLLLVAASAAWFPARRLFSVAPAEALRSESAEHSSSATRRA